MPDVKWYGGLKVAAGSGTVNRLTKFATAKSLSNSLLSDDGTDLSQVSGNFLLGTGTSRLSLTGTATKTGITMADQTDIGPATGGVLRFTNEPADNTAFTGVLALTSNNLTATSGHQSGTTVTAGFTPPSGSVSIAGLHVNPVLVGTSSGTAYGTLVAVRNTQWTGGTVTLASFGTTTTDGFTGYTEQVAIIPNTAITVGSGTGVTVNRAAALTRVVYKVTVTYAALAAAALTADKTIATLPAKTRLVGIIADTTTPYTGGAVSAATLIVGKTVGGNEYVISHDVFTAAVTKGTADADLGTSINRANAIQGGDLPSWTATTIVSVRLTTVTANTNALTAGSTTYYLVTEVHP